MQELSNSEPAINPEHSHLIIQIRDQLGSLFTNDFHTDFDILRWLQGHDFNTDIVVPKLRQHLRFIRCLNSIDYACHPLVNKYYPFAVLGPTGKDNNLVFLENTGGLDGEGLIRSLPITVMALSHLYCLEKVILSGVGQREAATGRQSGLVFIMDLEGLARNSIDIVLNVFRPYLVFLSQHFVEMFDKFVVVNAPFTVYYLWRLIKPFMPERTQRKVTILGSNWKKEIMAHVQADVLPARWGGSSPEPADGLLPERVPETLYWKPGPDDISPEKLNRLAIAAGGHEFVSVKISSTGSVLRWYYYTNGEYSFGVYYAEDEHQVDIEKMDMVYPHFGLLPASARIPEKVHFQCKKPGIYRLRFGNENAYISRLTVRYCVDVIESAREGRGDLGYEKVGDSIE